MDPRTGAIAQFESFEDAIKAGYTTRLSEAEAKLLGPVPRETRVAYANMSKNQQKAFRRKLKGK